MSSSGGQRRATDQIDARVTTWKPLWRTASRGEAVAILRAGREIIDSLIDGVPANRMSEIGPLGGGMWSINDLIGHLATWEERALTVLGVRDSATPEEPSTTDEFNAFHVSRKRRWPSKRVREDAASVRTQLIDAIARTTNERWLEKVDTGGKRSARGLFLGKVLTGARYGYFAHDLAHYRDLKKATVPR